jgi:hypothetical protein
MLAPKGRQIETVFPPTRYMAELVGALADRRGLRICAPGPHVAGVSAITTD